MYGIHKRFSHLSESNTQKSLTSFIFGYYVKMLDQAVRFDNSLALFLFGKYELQEGAGQGGVSLMEDTRMRSRQTSHKQTKDVSDSGKEA